VAIDHPDAPSVDGAGESLRNGYLHPCRVRTKRRCLRRRCSAGSVNGTFKSSSLTRPALGRYPAILTSSGVVWGNRSQLSDLEESYYGRDSGQLKTYPTRRRVQRAMRFTVRFVWPQRRGSVGVSASAFLRPTIDCLTWWLQLGWRQKKPALRWSLAPTNRALVETVRPGCSGAEGGPWANK